MGGNYKASHLKKTTVQSHGAVRLAEAEKFASLSCSFGLFGLSGLSRLFGLSGLT